MVRGLRDGLPATPSTSRLGRDRAWRQRLLLNASWRRTSAATHGGARRRIEPPSSPTWTGSRTMTDRWGDRFSPSIGQSSRRSGAR
eukprot:9192740-Pyramimonas_sp.AAC.1